MAVGCLAFHVTIHDIKMFTSSVVSGTKISRERQNVCRILIVPVQLPNANGLLLQIHVVDDTILSASRAMDGHLSCLRVERRPVAKSDAGQRVAVFGHDPVNIF